MRCGIFPLIQPPPGSNEEKYRKAVYQANIQRMNAHNSNKNRTYDMGLNKFSDWTEEEFQRKYATLILPEREKQLKDQFYR